MSACASWVQAHAPLGRADHEARLTARPAAVVQDQVNKLQVPDYSQFVLPSREIWLRKIAMKARRLTYTNSQEMCSDYGQLRDNCEAYNTPSNGLYGGPGEAWHAVLQYSYNAHNREQMAACCNASLALLASSCVDGSKQIILCAISSII